MTHSSDEAISRDRGVAFVLIGIYVFLRMAADPWLWASISAYYSYLFEFVFVCVTFFLFRRHIRLVAMPSLTDALGFAGMLGLGFLTYRAAGWLELPVPFDLSDSTTLFLLLLLGPVLEELVFRMALWESFQRLFGKYSITILATSVLFAFAHFLSYWFVPSEYQTFVIYQSSYVFLLALLIGYRRMRSGVVSCAIILHIGFNLGFYLGSRLGS